MHRSRYLFISLVICAAVLSSGCTQDMPLPIPVTPVTGSPAAVDPATLSLTQSDVPQGYTLVESRAKTPAEVSKLALELGWQGGYVARFNRSANEGEIEIVQSIAVYPERTIMEVISLAEQQGRSDNRMTYTNLTVQRLGVNARAFYGKPGSPILFKPTPANPVLDGLNSPEVPAVRKNEVAEILFSKGNTFEVFRMTGPSADTGLLISLAQKAYEQIP